MRAVILAGGFGTRLRPLTSTRPKPLMPFANEPFLLHTLRRLAAGGIDEVTLSTMYLPDAFNELLPLAAKAGVEVTLSCESAPLGTSGAVRLLRDQLDETFLVLNGDVLMDADVRELIATHRARAAVATIALVRVPDPSAFGLVPVDGDGRVRAFLEKPGADEWVTDLVNAGIYVLEPEVLDTLPSGPSSFERHLFPELLASGARVYGHELTGYWRDLGTPSAYLQAQFDLLEGRLQLPLEGAEEVAPERWLSPGAVIDQRAVVRGPVLLGAGARVEAEARVFGPAIIGPHAVVGAGARLERSVLLEGACLEPGARVSEAIVGARSRVAGGAVVGDYAVLGDDVVVEAENYLACSVRIAPGVHLPPGAVRLSGRRLLP